ncbi:hypothetical protein PSENEW3_00004363 [Picochlorum sp. SENEW3]|nr:hypothetical protein PSENEW3_00004363 [Picochlorum sp. SENEW3]
MYLRRLATVVLVVLVYHIGRGVRAESTELIDIIELLNCKDAVCGPIAVNCSYGDRGATWTEITNQANSTQYYSKTPASDLPDPLPAPYALSATDYSAPGNNGTCDSRSPMAPANCTENCVYNVVIPEISETDQWTIIAELLCSGTYPSSGSSGTSGGVSDVDAAPGTVVVVMTKQCKDYNYIPPWFASVTDNYGGKWALQTSESEMATDEDWKNNLDSVVFPDGWSAWENVTLTTNETHVPYLVGDDCFSFIIRDSNNNAWHMYEYPEDISTGLFANVNCIPFKLQTLDGIKESAPSSGSPMLLPTMAIGALGLQLFAFL